MNTKWRSLCKQCSILLQMLLYLNMRYMTETSFFWKQSVQLGELVLCKHTVSKIKSWIFHEINVPPFSNLCLCNSATPPQYDNLFFEFTWDDSLELQQSQVQVWVRMGGLYCSCLYQCVVACCVSLCVCLCVSGGSRESSFLCGAGGSFLGWMAGGTADMLSRSSSITRPHYCSAPHSLCPFQFGNTHRLSSNTSTPLLLSLTLQVQLICGPEEEEAQAWKQ